MSDVSEEFAIVLDDYHMIEAQPIHDAVYFLLNHLPRQVHLIIASRTNPPIPLAQLRVQNQLMEVRGDDLRFIPEESTAFLNDVMDLRISNEDVAILESRTEGWIASLQLAAISMQGRESVSTYISEFNGSSRYIMDYLIEEVLHRQEAGVQSFLLETSILNRFTVSLCNAVTGHDDSREKIAQLERTNLFLLPLNEERGWYRYHHLFAELLRNQLLRSQRERMNELHLRASKWFEQEGLIDEAIHHAITAKDIEQAAGLIEKVAFPMILKTHNQTVSGWLDQLPSELINSRPWLCLSRAAIYQLAGDIDSAEPLYQNTESVMSKAEEENPNVTFPDHARIRNIIRTAHTSYSVLRGDFQHAIQLCHEAFEYLPEDDFVTRAGIYGNLGISYWITGNLPLAKRYLEETVTFGQAGGNFSRSLLAMSFLGEIAKAQGHLQQAADRYRETIRLGSRWGSGEPLPLTGEAFIGLSQVLYEWNDLNGAIHHAGIGAKLVDRASRANYSVMGYLMLAWQNQACGNINAVTETLQRANENPPAPTNSHILVHASAWKARLSLAQGDLNAANRWAASQGPKLNLEDMPDFWSELPYLVLVRLHIAQGQIDEIPSLLDNLAQKVEAEKRTGSLIEILTLQSIALQAQGNLDQALIKLERALSLAESEGYVRTFVDEGEPMAKLLRLAASRGIAKKYVRKLLASFHRTIPGTEPQAKRSSAEGAIVPSPLIEPLSDRELDVLKLIVTGLSNREIAENLFIAESTVKTHINHIYDKLNVQSRTQAIAQTRLLNLL